MSYLSDFAEAIQENKDLYTEEEQLELMLIWEKEYKEYLKNNYLM
jgi:energy-converting hydrogenase A subunit M